MTRDDDRLELPAALVTRLDELDAALPPGRPWRPAAPAVDGVVRGRTGVHAGSRGTSGTLAAGVALLVVAVVGLGLAARLAPDGGGPGGASAGASGIAGSPPAPSSSAPPASTGPTPAASAGPTPASPTPRPSLVFKQLRLIDRDAPIEAILGDELGWPCPVRVGPPAEPGPGELAKVLRRGGVEGPVKLAGGIPAWVGTAPEPAALSFRASVVIRDADGQLWVVIKAEGPRVRRLASLRAPDGTLAWWLADAVAGGTCPGESGAPTAAPR